jgi:hypothetical protein
MLENKKLNGLLIWTIRLGNAKTWEFNKKFNILIFLNIK